MEHIKQSFAIEIKDPLLNEILERLSNAEQLSVGMLDNLAQALPTVSQLKQDFANFPEFPQRLKDLFDRNLIPNQLLNVIETIEQLELSLQQENLEQAKLWAQFHLVPFIHILKETSYFWGNIYPDKTLMDQYYANEFAAHYQPFQYTSTKPYQVSIVITAYNQVETTKQCIDQLFKYTDLKALNAELVLVDDGSSDGTYEYLKTVPNAKVIHLPHNTRGNTFAAIPWFCEGQYILLSNNDILFTKDWLTNLLLCMKSDPKIAIACPMTPHTTNHQSALLPCLEKDEFIEWANSYNHSDPNKWMERTCIMPTVAIYNTEITDKLGFCDPLFYALFFWDDDLSLRVRRNGYRQIQCEDIVCYHFGSVTMSTIVPKNAYDKDHNLVYSRKVFFKKHRVDAWSYDGTYNMTTMNVLRSLLRNKPNAKCLSIDGGFGDTLMQIKNRHKDLTLYSMTTKEQYVLDLKHISKQVEYYPCTISEAASKCFAGETFDLIYIGLDVSHYSIEIEELLMALKPRLKSDGKLVFFVSNPWACSALNKLLEFNVPMNANTTINPMYVQASTQHVFKYIRMIQEKDSFENVKEFVHKKFADSGQAQASIFNNLSIMSYTYICGVEPMNLGRVMQPIPLNF